MSAMMLVLVLVLLGVAIWQFAVSNIEYVRKIEEEEVKKLWKKE